MADKEEPGPEEPEDSDAASGDDDPNHLFGIDLGRRGDRAEQESRDEVEVAPVKKVRAAIRTLTERLASAASDRDNDAKRAKETEREKEKDPESTDE
jgi:hypothetical protein